MPFSDPEQCLEKSLGNYGLKISWEKEDIEWSQCKCAIRHFSTCLLREVFQGWPISMSEMKLDAASISGKQPVKRGKLSRHAFFLETFPLSTACIWWLRIQGHKIQPVYNEQKILARFHLGDCTCRCVNQPQTPPQNAHGGWCPHASAQDRQTGCQFCPPDARHPDGASYCTRLCVILTGGPMHSLSSQGTMAMSAERDNSLTV